MSPCTPHCPQGDCAGCTGERCPPVPVCVREHANGVLDSAKAGLDIQPDRITWALRMTGDLTDQPARAHLGGAV